MFLKIKLEKYVESLAKDLKPLIRFMKRFKCGQAVVISSDIERIERIEGLKLTILPYWRHWSIINEIKFAFGT